MCNKNKGIAFTLHNTYPKWQQHFTEHFPHALQSISRIRTSTLPNHARPPQGPEGVQSPRSWAGRLWKMKGCWPQETTELLRKENCGKQTDKTPVKHIFSSDKNSVHLPFQVHGRLASSREVASFLPFFFFPIYLFQIRQLLETDVLRMDLGFSSPGPDQPYPYSNGEQVFKMEVCINVVFDLSSSNKAWGWKG